VKFIDVYASPGTEDHNVFAALFKRPEVALWMAAVADLFEVSGVRDPALGGLLLIAGDATLSGDLCLRLTEERVKEAGRRLAVKADAAQIPDIRGILQKARDPDLAERFPGLIVKAGQESERLAPFVLDDKERLLYINKYFRMRRSLGQRLSAWVAAESSPIAGTVSAKQGSAVLTAEQLRAVQEAMRRRFLILTGGPGTGKTTVIQGILSAFYSAGLTENIWITAPTGRAARRALESASQVKGGAVQSGTIHSLLRALKVSMPAVVIIDEVSMVDLELMTELLGLLDPEKVRLILIGDRNQLPSVDAGAVLGDLVQLMASRKETECVVHLTESHRSGDRILGAADAVKAGAPFAEIPWEPLTLEEFAQEPPKSDGCYWLDSGPEQIGSVIRQWSGMILDQQAAEAIREAASMSPEDPLLPSLAMGILKRMRGRVLSVTRGGKTGAEHINALILQRLNRLLAASDALYLQGENWFSGMPLMVNRNDASRDVFNGETGILLRCGSVFRAVFDRGDRVNLLSLESLPESEPAFATTVHKSQGSEYDDVLVVLPADDTHPLLSRQILYTAITRARRRVFIAGRANVLASAVTRKMERETGGLLLRI
jgi:exodeoxyribonuclease V alpha subunit